MVHASGAGPHAFDRLVQLLMTEQRRFVAAARIGYGSTLIEVEGDLVARNVAAIDAVIADANADDTVLFGHSMGGLIGLPSAIGSVDRDARKLKALILYDPILVTLLRPDVDAERVALEWDRAIIAKFQAEVAAGRPEEELLRAINLPTLILVGERSPPLIHLTAARAAELIPSGEVELIADVDHMGPVNNPTRIAPAIERFLEGPS